MQGLGLTQHETPIDSRVVKWLRQMGFPVPQSASALASPEYYEFVCDGFQNVCTEAGLVPCMLDAAICASFDRERRLDGPT